ncbi:MAG: EAL domain-containing protein [Leucobacter sp.]
MRGDGEMGSSVRKSQPPTHTHSIAYQPIVDLANRRLCGYEALVRFTDGRAPLQHLAEARRDSSLVDLELELIGTAVNSCSDLPPDLLVSLNASANTIMDPRLSALIPPGTRTWGIELSEISTAKESARVREQVHAFGALLLVDDAGSGNADETRIRELQPDIVKIDKQVLWCAAADTKMRINFERLMDAARDANSRTLVEGVETPEQARLAQELHVELAQGYLYGAAGPLPRSE